MKFRTHKRDARAGERLATRKPVLYEQYHRNAFSLFNKQFLRNGHCHAEAFVMAIALTRFTSPAEKGAYARDMAGFYRWAKMTRKKEKNHD